MTGGELPVAVYLRGPRGRTDSSWEEDYRAKTWPGRTVVAYTDQVPSDDDIDWALDLSHRPELARLCDDIAAGKVGVVVTRNFIPNPVLSEIARKFRAAGLRVVNILGSPDA